MLSHGIWSTRLSSWSHYNYLFVNCWRFRRRLHCQNQMVHLLRQHCLHRRQCPVPNSTMTNCCHCQLVNWIVVCNRCHPMSGTVWSSDVARWKTEATHRHVVHAVLATTTGFKTQLKISWRRWTSSRKRYPRWRPSEITTVSNLSYYFRHLSVGSRVDFITVDCETVSVS